LKVVADPRPLYIVAGAMLIYNSLFAIFGHRLSRGVGNRSIVLQMIMDQIALILLLYFSNVPHNPFIFYFVFHVILATLLLHGWTPYLLACLASLLVGSVMILEYFGWIPVFALEFPIVNHSVSGGVNVLEKWYLVQSCSARYLLFDNSYRFGFLLLSL
jgi:hypothetical protein